MPAGFSKRAFLKTFRETLFALGDTSPREIIVHDEVDSTSSDLVRRLRTGSPLGGVVVAMKQHRGRGRLGREWHSPPAGNLYISVAVARPGAGNAQIPLVPLAAGIAAVDSVTAVSGLTPVLKWPNDLLVKGRKLGGLLTEFPDPTRRPDALVIGMGINLANTDFPGPLREQAVSLGMLALDRDVPPPDPAILAAHWIFHLKSWLDVVAKPDLASLRDAWKNRAEPFGRRVVIDGMEATTVDLAEDGRLIVQGEDGDTRLVAGGVVETPQFT